MRILLSMILLANSVSPLVAFAETIAPYGSPVNFRSAPLTFKDFKLSYLGEREMAGPGQLVFHYDDFKIESGSGTQRLSWSPGTGVIAPVSFSVGKEQFLLELHRTLHGNKKLADDELVITKLRRIPGRLGVGLELRDLLPDDLIEFPSFTLQFGGSSHSTLYEKDTFNFRITAGTEQTSLEVPAENLAVFDISGQRYSAETLGKKLTVRLQK